MNRLIQLNKEIAAFFVALGLGCLCFSPLAQAASPPPDGGYGWGNTATGAAGLLHNTTGGFNTATGSGAL